MPELTQFKESYPIIRDVPISTKATGTEKIADVFGAASKAVAAEAVQLKKEQKEAMILHDSNRLIEISNQAKINMRLNPRQASQIAAKAREAGETILNTAPEEYREKLRTTYDSHIGGVGLEAAGISYKQNQLQTKLALYDELPEQLNDLNHTFDPKEFEVKAKNLMGVINTAGMAGTITPGAHKNYTSQIRGILERHEALHAMATDANVDAAKYSHATNYQFTNDHTGAGGRPSDQNHNELASHYSQEDTYAKALSDAQKGNMPSPDIVADLTENQFQMVKWQLHGALGAKADWDVDKGYDYIKHEVTELEAKPSLTEEEKGRLAYHKYQLKKLDNGDSQEVSVNTNSGSRSFEQYQQDKAAIESTHFTAPTEDEANAKKAAALHENDMKYLYRQRADDDARGIPADKRNYIDAQTMIPVASAFKAGGDPVQAVNAIYSLPKDMQYWMTASLKDPQQKAAMWSVALRRNSMPSDKPADVFSLRLIKAAQSKTREQLEYENKVLSRGKDESTPDSKIRVSIESELSDKLDFMKNVPEGDKNNSSDWRNGTVQLGVQYVKDRMIETGDYEGKNAKQFVQEYADGQNRNYKLFSGMNYTFNLNEINLPKGDLDALAAYEIINFQEHSQKYGGKTLAEMAQDLSHPNVINTRDGSVAVVAPDGTVLHSERITPSLVNAAVHARMERQVATQALQQKKSIFNQEAMDQAVDNGILEVPAK